MPVVFNHLGHCVADLGRSRRFYEDLLEFEFLREINPPDDPSNKLLRLKNPMGMTACYLKRDGFILELLHFGGEGAKALPPRERAMNEPGLTHISVSVDVDDICARIGDFAGEVLEDTNIGFGVFVKDPDGQLIELLPLTYRDSLEAGH